MHPDVDALADQLVDVRFAHEPLEAALLGLRERSVGVGDLSAEGSDALIRRYREIAVASEVLGRRLRAAGELEERDTLILDVVGHAATSTADELATGIEAFTLSGYTNAPVIRALSYLAQLSLASSEDVEDYLERLRAVPEFCAQAGEGHLRALGSGRSPTMRGATNAVAYLDRVLGEETTAGLVRGEGEWRDTLERVVRDDVRPALVEYRDLLANALAPRGRDDDHAGLCALAHGAEIYEVMTRVWTSTARTPAELHRRGLTMVDLLRDNLTTVGRRLWDVADASEVHHRLLHDPALRYERPEEMIDVAIETVRRAEAALAQWFVTVPDSPCRVEVMPAALADSLAVGYYLPGAVDGTRQGTFFVNTAHPAHHFRYMTEAVAFHEGVPGHHFQDAVSQHVPGAHLVQSVFADGAYEEGWGLYSERLAYEMGLYSDDLALLGMLCADILRAARLVVDTGVHAFGWSRSRAIAWMSDHVALSDEEIALEVDRYISAPGQALSYMVGRLEIDALRAEAATRLGDAFDLRAFHDVVLRTGPVSLRTLSGTVHRWMQVEASRLAGE